MKIIGRRMYGTLFVDNVPTGHYFGPGISVKMQVGVHRSGFFCKLLGMVS